MKGIRWFKSYYGYRKETPNYNAKIGHIKLCCRPSIRYLRDNKRRIFGWTCNIYLGNKQIGQTTREQSLEFTQKEAEKLAIKYLLGYSHVVLKALKKIGLLEDMLSEIGIDL